MKAIKRSFMELALYQPDIAPNVGTLIRMGACLGVRVNIIEPCGFPFGAKDLRRAVMDYASIADVERHSSFENFQSARPDNRLILLTTRSSVPYVDFEFLPSDILLVGQESAGVPEEIHQAATARVIVPMQKEARSLNVALSAAIVTSEALRQTNGLPNLS